MLVLLSSSFFTLLATLTVPDRFFIFEAQASFKLQGVVLSLQGFLIAASFILIVELVYLHIFYGYWHQLEAMGARPEGSVPTLFNLKRRDARLATEVIFYWWIPFVFFAMAFKATVRPFWAIILYSLATITLAALVFLRIRRSPGAQRRGIRRRWAFLALLIASWPVMIVNLHNLTLFRPLNFARADLPQQRLSSLFLVGADFREANLQGSNLSTSNLRLANFYRADLSAVNLSHSSLRRADLAAANLRSALLTGANLQNANLKDANLRGSDLSNANLTNADCRLTNFTEASLRYAVLQSTNLSGATLSKSDLRFAELDGALLAHADLQGAQLSDLDLADVNLASANMQGATLRSSSLVGANLAKVNFREADLRLAVLRKANLQDAELGGANLEGADLRGAANVTSKQLIDACGNDDTMLPDQLARPPSWPCDRLDK